MTSVFIPVLKCSQFSTCNRFLGHPVHSNIQYKRQLNNLSITNIKQVDAHAKGNPKKPVKQACFRWGPYNI